MATPWWLLSATAVSYCLKSPSDSLAACVCVGVCVNPGESQRNDASRSHYIIDNRHKPSSETKCGRMIRRSTLVPEA